MVVTLDKLKAKYDLQVRGILQIGAHYGGEYPCFVDCGVQHMIFFEPVKDNFNHLLSTIDGDDRAVAYNIALGNTKTRMRMYVETHNKGMSCSLLAPGTHLRSYPRIRFNQREWVDVEMLDSIAYDHTKFNMIVIDVQGYELEVFKGATEALKHIDYVYSEVNVDEVYKGCARVEQLDEFLKPYGFIRIMTDMCARTWGDALYIKYA